jgi:hypothetical protein
MRRSGFASKPLPARRSPEVTPIVECRGVVRRVADTVVVQAKPQTHRDQRIRDSARDEPCLVRLPGCPSDPAMTIWSHYRGSAGGKGIGIKAGDVCGCFACTYCDAVYDGQKPRPAGMSKAAVDLAWHEAHIRSLGRLHEKGLL